LQIPAWISSTMWLLSIFGLFYFEFRLDSFRNLLFTGTLTCFMFASLFQCSKLSTNILSFPPVYLIGGMCYSIYLLHYPLISFFGKFMGNSSEYLFLKMVAVLTLILITSAAFYLFIEKPTMYRDWFKNPILSTYKKILQPKTAI
jgi:peptidoglycan/LPS O-acetylase OafA/YrhL